MNITIVNEKNPAANFFELWLGDVYEMIPCTDESRKTIEEAYDAAVD